MIKLQNISANWARLWRLLDPKSRAKYSLVIALSVIVALLEIAGLGILLHTVLSILNPDFIQENEVINYLYELFQTKSEQKFILIITVLLFASYVLKNIVLVPAALLRFYIPLSSCLSRAIRVGICFTVYLLQTHFMVLVFPNVPDVDREFRCYSLQKLFLRSSTYPSLM